MELTRDQMEAVLARIASEAADALAQVNANTGGLFHSWISGDTGGGERTLIATVRDVVIPSLRRREDQALELGATDNWLVDAHSAEQQLADAVGISRVGTVDQILADTAAATAGDAVQLAGHGLDVAGRAIAAALPWWVWIGLVVAGAGAVAVLRREA
jgi:hypothetical protein